MQRVPEPELMEDPKQARAYAEADFAEPHQAFVEHFRLRFPNFHGGRVLDLGCGPADVTVRFARAFPHTRITAVDGSAAMLELARQRLAAEALTARIELVHLRLPAPLAGRYDAVISNSLLHHLADPSVLWKTLRATARPGACVLVMDLMRPDCIEEAERLVACYAADAPAVLRRDFFNSLLAAYQPREVADQLAKAGLAHFQVEPVSDRHWLAWGRLADGGNAS
ncbi:class I SAM-dependent methyltransferase [Thiobacter aerophilum]|uniref:Class I SAM-dependent methyltransferase n=1 Tax=Thiobacter aerophilum TaxID=3121275 RepID=A0ABV0EFP1_9BURK